MATIPITANDGFQGGRVSDQPSQEGKSFLRYAAPLTTDTYQFQFSQAAGVSLTFGVARSVFIDNAQNDYALSVYISATAQTFPVPANATGWFPIDALTSSNIDVTSEGASTGPVEIIFYNYDRTTSPFVYYKFGAATTAVTIADGADVTQGSVNDAAVTNPATSGTVIALLKGIITKLTTATVGTAVTVANGADVTQGAIADAAVVNPASSGSVIALLKGILTQALAIVTNTSDTVSNTADIITNTNAFSYDNITTSTTTVVKNAPGTLGKVTVNTAGGAGTIIVYDNTSGSGSVIATLDSTVIGSFDYNVSALTGITVVTTGAPDITVTYK